MMKNITLKTAWMGLAIFLLGAGITNLVFSTVNNQAMTTWGKVALIDGVILLGAFMIVRPK